MFKLEADKFRINNSIITDISHSQQENVYYGTVPHLRGKVAL